MQTAPLGRRCWQRAPSWHTGSSRRSRKLILKCGSGITLPPWQGGHRNEPAPGPPWDLASAASSSGRAEIIASRRLALISLAQVPWSLWTGWSNIWTQSRALLPLPPRSLNSRSARPMSAQTVGHRELNPSKESAPSPAATSLMTRPQLPRKAASDLQRSPPGPPR